jgi:hypothetical protein
MKLKTIYLAAMAAAMALATAAGAQQDKPGAVAAQAAEAVVTVREVNRDARTVTIEGPEGNLVTIAVPPEAQNLDQVHPGSQFRLRYLQSVAVFISPEGGEPAAGEASTMELAEKGATPGGVIATVKQIQARVEQIDYATRNVVLTGPGGDRIEVVADERVKRLNEVKPGDLVVVRYTEALALKMIKK